MAKLPTLDRKHKICVICEGYEDFVYFNRLLQLGIWNSRYAFSAMNAKSASNIPAMFQDTFQNDRYEIILVFCDTDPHTSRYLHRASQGLSAYLFLLRWP